MNIRKHVQDKTVIKASNDKHTDNLTDRNTRRLDLHWSIETILQWWELL